MRTATRMVDGDIEGLLQIDDWVSADDEAGLLAAIDDAPWRDDLSRRVQHYGWRYDYRARSIDASMRIGPLPPWAEALADRVAREGLSARPEQVIVNEYVAGQGIAAHVDCVRCFGPVVLSLSLGSGCAMELSREGHAPRSLWLAPRSLLALSGDARERWKHRIAPRKSDVIDGVRRERGRRVSVTFRTVRLEGAR